MQTNRLYNRVALITCVIPVIMLTFGCTAQPKLRGTPIASISLNELHDGTADIDLRLLEAFEPVPAPIRQYFIETRALFDATDEQIDFDHPSVLRVAAEHNVRILGGPMLGNLTASGVTVWLRPATHQPLRLTVTDTSGSGDLTILEPTPAPGRVLRFELKDLKPESDYIYTIESDGEMLANGSFTTAPLDDTRGLFRMAFGADFHKIGQHNPALFKEIAERDPSIMLLLGDSAADDRRENMNLHRADYFSRNVSPPWSGFARNVPVYAIWDDHDYFDDDLSGLQGGVFKESDREAIREVWNQNWNNPPAPESREGIYFKARVGPVEIFMLDTRSCRNRKVMNTYGSYLGQTQQKWLIEGLRTSTAPFKLLCSGTMWSDYVSKGKDSWATWDTEALEEIFQVIESEPVGGVLLLSGDRHGARGFRIPRPSGFDLIELEVGCLGGIHGPKGIIEGCEEQIFGYTGSGFIAFGEFDFDTSKAVPTVTFRLIDDEGAILQEHRWTLSELTAHQKID